MEQILCLAKEQYRAWKILQFEKLHNWYTVIPRNMVEYGQELQNNRHRKNIVNICSCNTREAKNKCEWYCFCQHVVFSLMTMMAAALRHFLSPVLRRSNQGKIYTNGIEQDNKRSHVSIFSHIFSDLNHSTNQYIIPFTPLTCHVVPFA